MEAKEELIKAVLDLELEMFLAVRSLEPASCQQNPGRFRTMRRAQFLAWSEKTLGSYLEDLQAAKAVGRNLMTLKYARMDGLIPPWNTSPLVERIAAIQLEWQRELAREYPGIMGRGRSLADSSETQGGASFKGYLTGELETYSEKTLESLYGDMEGFLNRGGNMTRAIYEHMMQDLGYQSLEEAETSVRPDSGEGESGP